MEPPPPGVCFIDTCIILNKILGEDLFRTEKFFNDMREVGIGCYISPSVDKECDEKITTTLNYIGDSLKIIFQGGLKYYIEKQGRDENSIITREDIRLLERVFIECYVRGVLRAPARRIEELIITFIESKLKNGEQVSLKELIVQLTTEIFSLSNELKDKYDDLELMHSPEILRSIEDADPVQSAQIQLRFKGIGLADAKHLSSMRVFERKNNIKTVFVTSDYGILNNKINLQNTFNITCSNPLYAVHNF